MSAIHVAIAVSFLLSSFVLGVIATLYVVARDPDLYRLKEDEKIVKSPRDGFVLVQVPLSVARKLVNEVDDKRGESVEARNLYPQNKTK